ncbi:eukaryotic translation initiation factor 1-like [Camelus ferus]|uniref:Eukaryotic translation initiation factor 1-like n=2 Tax=Camelus TaxID=9836 RepID=A0A8B8S4S4_CAMFR|nr:eukaryotic translation initiation factor 1-like [Camelus ferus]XP_045362748.1 eukaryotic translation initiation factor 1-like [Camelus bactrianus]
MASGRITLKLKDSEKSPTLPTTGCPSSPLPAFSCHHLLLALPTEQKESHCSSTIQNLQSLHPFTDASKSDALLPTGTEDYNYIRIRQSNSRKTLTTVQGFADDYNKKKLVKMFKEKFACNGTVMEHPECGELIQPRGDQQKNMSQFLTETGLTEDDQWKAHGF